MHTFFSVLVEGKIHYWKCFTPLILTEEKLNRCMDASETRNMRSNDGFLKPKDLKFRHVIQLVCLPSRQSGHQLSPMWSPSSHIDPINITIIFFPSCFFSVSLRLASPSTWSCNCLGSDMFSLRNGSSSASFPGQSLELGFMKISQKSLRPLDSSPGGSRRPRSRSLHPVDHVEHLWRAIFSWKWRSESNRIQGRLILLLAVYFASL